MKLTKRNKMGFTPLETQDVHRDDEKRVSYIHDEGTVVESRLRKRQRRFLSLTGFTLAEVMITVTIVGTLTAVAVPNFMRAKMNTNMELVKQQMRIISEKLTEIMGVKGSFPAEEEWGAQTGDQDLLSVTASLSAIDGYDYTTDDYTTYDANSNYRYRSCPKTGKWGSAGDQCFVVDPTGIRTVDPLDGTGVNMNAWSASDLSQALQNGSNEVIKGDILNGVLSAFRCWAQQMMISGSYTMEDLQQNGIPVPEGSPVSQVFAIPKDQSAAFAALFNQLFQDQLPHGWQLQIKETNIEKLDFSDTSPANSFTMTTYNALANPNVALFEIGISGTYSIHSENNLGSDLNQSLQQYNNWVRNTQINQAMGEFDGSWEDMSNAPRNINNQTWGVYAQTRGIHEATYEDMDDAGRNNLIRDYLSTLEDIDSFVGSPDALPH